MMHRPLDRTPVRAFSRSRSKRPARRHGPSVASAGAGALLAAAALAGGCASTEEAGTGNGSPTTAPVAATEPMEDLSPAEMVELRYVIGPAAARDFGYRVDWQSPSRGFTIRKVEVAYDSVFTLDERNLLTRLRREDGERVWDIPAAQPIEEILGISFVPSAERIYLTVGGEIYVLDASTGSRVSRQTLNRAANTEPVRFGSFLVYGARSGQLIWHSYLLDSVWRAYQIAPSIDVAPVVSDGYIVAVGSDGRVMSLDARSASQIWNRKALAPIEARPVAGNGVVYVASLDQHLRAYEITERRSPLWEYLTESPLTEAPVLIDDRVYQHVPTEGLVCLEALPLDSPGGVVLWRMEDVHANVVTRIGRNLLAWNETTRSLHVIDERLGAVVRVIDLPQVVSLHASKVDGGSLYAVGADGRVERLVPRI